MRYAAHVTVARHWAGPADAGTVLELASPTAGHALERGDVAGVRYTGWFRTLGKVSEERVLYTGF